MKYPITLGGFAGQTQIEVFAFNNNGDLTIAGQSNDPMLVTTSASAYVKIVLYLPAGASTYLWSKQIIGAPASPFVSINFNTAMTEFFVF